MLSTLLSDPVGLLMIPERMLVGSPTRPVTAPRGSPVTELTREAGLPAMPVTVPTTPESALLPISPLSTSRPGRLPSSALGSGSMDRMLAGLPRPPVTPCTGARMELTSMTFSTLIGFCAIPVTKPVGSLMSWLAAGGRFTGSGGSGSPSDCATCCAEPKIEPLSIVGSAPSDGRLAMLSVADMPGPEASAAIAEESAKAWVPPTASAAVAPARAADPTTRLILLFMDLVPWRGLHPTHVVRREAPAEQGDAAGCHSLVVQGAFVTIGDPCRDPVTIITRSGDGVTERGAPSARARHRGARPCRRRAAPSGGRGSRRWRHGA